MIEKESAVENLDAILSVKGVDMVQFGPADYSMSIGLAGQLDAPAGARGRALRHRDRAEDGHRAAGRDRRIPTRRRRYLDMGVKHFCIGSDVSILSRWFKEAGGAMREILGRGSASGDGARPAPRRAETAYPQGE